MRKALLLVFTLLMLASFSFGIVFAAAQNEFDENGWFQNQNMSALKTNEEGASEFTLGGSVPTYNRTEIDLTKINYLYFRTTSGDWTAFHLIDDTSIVSGNGATWYPSNNTEGKGHVKVSALLNDGAMQLGNGYATPEQGIIGTDKGSPSDVDRYMKFAFYIGTGEGDDVSYLEIDGVKIVGQAGTSLSVKRSDFANGKCYVALQTFSPNKTIAAMGINEDPARLPEVAFQPTGLGANNSAGFMLNETIADIPAEGYQITAEKAINNVTVNGKTLADVQAGLFVMTVPFGDSTIQSIGLLPSEGTSFSWKAGDEIVFKNGFVVYGPTGTPLYQISRDYGFSVISVDESGNCNFIPQVGLTWNGNSGNFVNLNLSYEVPCTAAVSDRNITAVTVNGEPLNSVGYFNLATPGIVQILKNEGEWNWKDGDTIKLPKDFTFKDSNGTVYCLDAAYKAVYAKGSFSFGKDFGINDYVPVSVDSMKLGHYDANGNMYGMQVYFSENVRGELEANSDVAGQEWFHSFVKINGKTLAEIKAMNIGTQDAPEYPSVRANFEGENFITLWIDGRAGVIEPGNNRVGDGNIVTILAGIRFPSGYETTEEVSFEFYNDGWKPVVVLEPIEFDVQNDAVLEGGSQGTDTKKAFINIPIKLSGFTDIPAIEIHGSQEVLEHIMFNGQLFSQMAAGTRVIQYNSANVLQIEIPQAAWNEGDKLVFLKGMPFFVDAPTKVGASAELARYYILECVIDSDGTPRFTVTVTDSYEADEDISLDFAGVQKFLYDADKNEYSFQLHFTKNIRGDEYAKFADITNEEWIKNYITINGKTIDELLAAKDADGNVIANAVRVVFENDKFITFYVSKKIAEKDGGVVDAEGNILDKITLSIEDGIELPRGGKIAMGSNYKYELEFWCRDVDLSALKFSKVKILSVANPVSVDDDGNIAFKIYFDKNITEGPYLHINAGADWLSGVELGYTPATIDYLASYGFIRDCLTKILYNGKTIKELMETEADPDFRPINVVMVHYDKNELQIVFRATSINDKDGTYGKPGAYAVNIADPNPSWSITFLEGFSVPSMGKTSREYSFAYNAETKKFEEVIKEEVISEVEFVEVYYNGTKIDANGTLVLNGVTELDKNLFTIIFKNGVMPPWTIESGILKEGLNSVTLVASTTDGSGKTATFVFQVNVSAGENGGTPNVGLIVGLSVGGVALAGLAVATVLVIKKKKAGK